MYQVKIYNTCATGKPAEVHKFKLWQEVRVFLTLMGGKHPTLVIHPNGELVFPDSPNGEPVQQRGW